MGSGGKISYAHKPLRIACLAIDCMDIQVNATIMLPGYQIDVTKGNDKVSIVAENRQSCPHANQYAFGPLRSVIVCIPSPILTGTIVGGADYMTLVAGFLALPGLDKVTCELRQSQKWSFGDHGPWEAGFSSQRKDLA